MCKALEDLVAEGIEQGIGQGIEQGIRLGERQKLKKQIEKKLHKGYSEEEIADMLEENIDVIRELVTEIDKEE